MKDFSLTGKRKYRCDDCKQENFFHWKEFNRAARPRCLGCGCSRLEIVSTEGKKEQILNNQTRLQGHRSMVLARNRRRGKVV